MYKIPEWFFYFYDYKPVTFLATQLIHEKKNIHWQGLNRVGQLPVTDKTFFTLQTETLYASNTLA